MSRKKKKRSSRPTPAMEAAQAFEVGEQYARTLFESFTSITQRMPMVAFELWLQLGAVLLENAPENLAPLFGVVIGAAQRELEAVREMLHAASLDTKGTGL